MSSGAPQTVTKTQAHTILVIDDEASIRRTLSSIFSDEGFNVLCAESGDQALSLLNSQIPSVVLLDIWMPGIDGLDLLQRIKARFPTLPVIMISGHATIATAVKATHCGASDFIEKPLDLHATLESVKNALGFTQKSTAIPRSFTDGTYRVGNTPRTIITKADTPVHEYTGQEINPIVFSSQSMRGKKRTQRTIAHSAVLYGQGLHSGKKSGLILEPLPENSGIHFVGVSETTMVPAHVDYVESTGFATTVKLAETQAGTIEHLMSALHAYGIANLLIKCNGEVPVLDGSAREFCTLFEEVGVIEQPGDWFDIKIDRIIRVGNENEFIQVEPHSHFAIDYTLQYGSPLGKQHLSFSLEEDPNEGIKKYREQIAPSRTFGFVKDIGALQKQGLALGGRFDNFVLFSDDGAINDSLRFPDEPVRHKILDAIGDLYLLGRHIEGKVTAQMTGHSDNIALLKKVRELLV